MSNTGLWPRRLAATGALTATILGLGAGLAFAAEPLPTATAGRIGGGRGMALGLPGVVVVSESTAQGTTSHWTGLSVAGVEVIGRSPTGWTGAAAAVGEALEEPTRPCYGVEVRPYETILLGCVNVLSGQSSGHELGSGASGEIAGAQVSLITPDGVQNIVVQTLPSNANSQPDCGGSASGSASLGYVAATDGAGNGTVIPLAPEQAATGC